MDSAFESSKIKEISIPSTVTYIGNKAFYQCTYLENINDFSEMTGLETIGMSAFAGCGKITVSNLVLPENVNAIENFTFAGINAKNLTIPASVKTIGMGAFANSSLENATFENQSWTRQKYQINTTDGKVTKSGNASSVNFSNETYAANQLKYYYRTDPDSSYKMYDCYYSFTKN